MAIEFERRFKVDLSYVDFITQHSERIFEIHQGYVCDNSEAVVRLRNSRIFGSHISDWYFTVKMDTGLVGKHKEFEYIVQNGEDLFAELSRKVHKIRSVVPLRAEGIEFKIEVDMFIAPLIGCMIAEVELKNDAESDVLSRNLPAWFGEEITGEANYSNFHIANNGGVRE